MRKTPRIKYLNWSQIIQIFNILFRFTNPVQYPRMFHYINEEDDIHEDLGEGDDIDEYDGEYEDVDEDMDHTISNNNLCKIMRKNIDMKIE